MYKIVRINYNFYISDTIDKPLFEKFLLTSKCDCKGRLELRLEPGRKLIQKGPFLIPFIRWIDSFEDDAEFDIVCDVEDTQLND